MLWIEKPEDVKEPKGKQGHWQIAYGHVALGSHISFIISTNGLGFEKKKRILKELRKNKNIVILRPDKGNGVVILDRAEYDWGFI